MTPTVAMRQFDRVRVPSPPAARSPGILNRRRCFFDQQNSIGCTAASHSFFFWGRIPAMSEDRKRPGVAFWATVMVVVGVAYVLSIGPAHSEAADEWLGDGAKAAVRQFYWPINWLCQNGPPSIKRVIEGYVSLWR